MLTKPKNVAIICYVIDMHLFLWLCLALSHKTGVIYIHSVWHKPKNILKRSTNYA